MTRGAFLSKLLEARGLDWSGAKETNGAAFILRTGLVTDSVGNLNAQTTRREALRWCIQALGLAAEAEILSSQPALFQDVQSLTAFERGCLLVASRMNPPLLAKAEAFRGGQRLTDKEMNALLERVRAASLGLSLDVTLKPLNGVELWLHRDGVSTGIPRWRVCADGFEDQGAAEAARAAFRTQGFNLSPIHPLYEWFLRTPILDDYGVVRRLAPLIRKRGLSPRVLPSVSNPDTSLLPRYWVLLSIDPSFWRMTPILSKEGPRLLCPLSQLAKESDARAAINAGFFSVTGRDRGFPIGALRVQGELLSKPYAGRSALGWNEEDEAAFGVVSLSEGTLTGPWGESWEEMTEIVQAGPLLLDEGQPQWNTEDFSSSIISARHPRSVVGLTEDGRWFLLAVDGRNGFHSVGATLSELMEILRVCGASCALNLDGGGSTALVLDGRLWNAPSEGKERSISYGLGILPR